MKDNTILRIIALAILLISLLVIGKYTPLKEWFEPEAFIDRVRDAGIYGMFIFVILFCIGLLLYIPALIFIFFATLLYGPINGMLISYIASFIAVTINFYVVRIVGGQALKEIRQPFVKKHLDKINEQPILTIFLLRLVMWMAPLLNTVLALSKIKPKQYHLGNLIGIIIPVAGLTLGFYFFQTTFVSLFIH